MEPTMLLVLLLIAIGAGIVGALSMAMTFHGLYNLLVSEPGIPSYIGYVLPMLFALLLYLIDRKPFSGDDEEIV